FFQAEEGIRDWSVTGVQTCALPISPAARKKKKSERLHEVIRGSFDPDSRFFDGNPDTFPHPVALWPTRKRCPACQNSGPRPIIRSEERRVGKECASGGWRNDEATRT